MSASRLACGVARARRARLVWCALCAASFGAGCPPGSNDAAPRAQGAHGEASPVVEAWPAPEPLPALATTRDEALRFAQRFVAVPNARQALGQALAGQGPIDVTLDAQRYQGGQERHEHTFASGQALLSCLKDPADPRGPWAGPRSFGSCSLPKPLRQYLDSPRRFGQIVMDSCDDLCCTFAPSASVVQSALMLRRVCFDGVSPQRAVRRVELYGTW